MHSERTAITWQRVQDAVLAAPTSAPAAYRFAPASVPQILSDTKRGLVMLVMQREGLSREEARARVLHDDLRHLLPLAPEAARAAVLAVRGITPSTRAAACNAAARCRQALRVIDQNLCSRHGLVRDYGATVPEAWRPLVDVLTPTGEGPNAARRTLRSNLLRVIYFQVSRGLDTPALLPADPDELAAQFLSAGVNISVVGNLLHAVRRARRLGEASGIDVSAVPLWPAKRLGKSYTRYGADWRSDPRAGLERDLPVFAKWLSAWLSATEKSVSPATRASIVEAICRVGYALKSMAGAGRLQTHQLATLTPFDVCELNVPGATIGEALPPSVSRSEITASVGLGEALDTTPLIHALTRFLTEEQPIRRVIVSHRDFIPPGVRIDIERTWLLVRGVIRNEMLRQDAARWSAADLHYRAWLNEVRELHVKAGAPSARDTQRLLDHVTLPQLIVLGLPWFDLVHLPRRVAEIMRARTPADRLGATAAYRDSLFTWAVLAVGTSAPLRLDQMQFGRVATGPNREFELEAVFSPDGQLTAVKRVTTHFGGLLHHFPDNPQAALKQRLAPLLAWVCRPSLLNMERLGDYLREVWWTRALERGLDRGRNMEQTLADGDLALFLSDRNGSSINTWGGYGGNGADLADRFGEAILLVMRSALGRIVPATKREAMAAGWSYLLTEHTIRHQYATYWYGLRGDHAVIRRINEQTQVVRSGSKIAQEATRDSEKTLARSYKRVTKSMASHLDRPASSWEHPYLFNDLMDKSDDPNIVIDWAAEWDTLLERCRDGSDALPPPLRELWERRNVWTDTARQRRGGKTAPRRSA
jgi:hypothetical protein